MICPNCGTNLDDNATECFLCGCHIEEQTISDDGQNYSVNACPVCGSEISEQESVCPICGSPIEKISQTENNQEEYNTENIEESETQNKSNKNLIIIIIVVVVAAIIGILVFLFLGKGDTKDVQSNVSQTEAATTLTTEAATETSTAAATTSAAATTTTETTTTVTTAATETYADISGYIGFWHKESMGEERELTITSVKRDTVIFTLWYYRIDAIEDVPATLEDNTAYFDTGDVQGYLTFEDDIITVVITNSSRPYMSSEVMTFDGRHEHSWEYEGFDTAAVFEPYIIEVTNPKLSIYEAPTYDANIVGEITDKSRYTIVEEFCDPFDSPAYFTWGKLKSGLGWINLHDATMPDDPFYDDISADGIGNDEDTPNVWCPNCGYRFFTSGVGTEGFTCPSCGHNWLP